MRRYCLSKFAIDTFNQLEMTVTQIANISGYSCSTVRRYLDGLQALEERSETVSEDIEDSIRKVAKKYNACLERNKYWLNR